MRKITLILIAFFGLGFSGDSINRYFLVERVFLMPFVIRYSQEIGLSQDQIDRIRSFIREHEAEIDRKRKLIEALSRYAKLMMLEGREEREIRELLGDIALLKLEMSLMNARCISFLRETLTQEQFDKLKSIVTVRFFEIQR